MYRVNSFPHGLHRSLSCFLYPCHPCRTPDLEVRWREESAQREAAAVCLSHCSNRLGNFGCHTPVALVATGVAETRTVLYK